MDNTIRNWVALSMLGGHAAEQLKPALLKAGFSSEEIDRELADAGPYISMADTIQKKLLRREGLMKTLDFQLRNQQEYLSVTKRKLPPFEEFMADYYTPNRSGVFTSVLDNCAARHWTPRNLVERLGADTQIEVQSRKEARGTYEYSANRFAMKMKFGDYIDVVESTGESNDFYMAGGNYHYNRSVFAPLLPDISDFGDGYLVPEDENMNKVQFMFGRKGAVTPLHQDNVNVLLVQIYGTKLVRFIPALQSPYISTVNNARNADFDLLNPDMARYPGLAEATVFETVVHPGEALFIPIGWWHHVTCLSANISVICCNIKVNQDYKTFFS